MSAKTGLGYFITQRRKLLRMTQDELAKLVGVSKSAIAKWETNGGLPDRDNLRALAGAIGVSVSDLHMIIEKKDLTAAELEVNITGDVIAALESYGYKVIKVDTPIEGE